MANLTREIEPFVAHPRAAFDAERVILSRSRGRAVGRATTAHGVHRHQGGEAL